MSEIEAEREMTRSEIASYLREFADELDTSTNGVGAETEYQDDHDRRNEDDSSATVIGTETESHNDDHRDDNDFGDDREHGIDHEHGDGRITFMVGNDSTTINPPERLFFEVEVGSDDGLVGSARDQEVSFELAWEHDETREDERDAEMEIK